LFAALGNARENTGTSRGSTGIGRVAKRPRRGRRPVHSGEL